MNWRSIVIWDLLFGGWGFGVGLKLCNFSELELHLHIMKKIILGLLIVPVLFSCSERKQKINYANAIDTVGVIDDRKVDTTKIMISELPVKFDSTEVLIFAVGLVNLEERGGYSKFRSGSYSDFSSSHIYTGNNTISGDFINLIFQDSVGEKRILTKNKIRLKQASFLKSTYRLTGKPYILYLLYDRDTNGDKQINPKDLEALYLSNIDGTNFAKLTRELHEFYDYTLIDKGKKLFFRTLEDINKDGKLNNKDKFHYYSIDFEESQYKVTEFYPLDVFNE